MNISTGKEPGNVEEEKVSYLTPFEIKSGSCLNNNSKIVPPKNIDIENKEYQERSPGNIVMHFDGSCMIEQPEDQCLNHIEDISSTQLQENSDSLTNEFECHLQKMEMKGLEFELPVSSLLRATKFNPFQKKLCSPIRFGTTRTLGPHMRGFWFATISFFLAFLGLFSIAGMMVLIREDLRICDNQNDMGDGITECSCTKKCRRTIANLKIASFSSNTIMRLIIGGLLETYGPKNVQCGLLLSGAFFVASVSLIQDVNGLIIVLALIGTVGASFVTNQFWMPLLFSPEILGIVNGTAAGWGNLGGGVSNMVMPLLELLTGNWRTTLLIPACLMLLCSVFMFFFSQDTPMGPFVAKRDLRKNKASFADYLKCISDYRVCILAVQYGACFGAEVTMYWELPTYFHDYFWMSLVQAGCYSSIFGLMNIFARSLGGFFSDYLYEKMGLRGRLLSQFVFIFCEALCLLIFGYINSGHGWVKAFIVLIFFSLFTQAAEASTFSLVPNIQQQHLGVVSAITAAGGNLFAAVAQVAFYRSISDFHLSFKFHSVFVLCSAFLTFFIGFELQGSLLFKPKLGKYCPGSFFAYALEWELQFDSRYYVVGSYISPAYKGLLFKLGKKGSYVKAAKKRNIEFGEGLVGRVGRTRKHCMVEMISEHFSKINQNDMIRKVIEDQIQTVLFFASEDGRSVVEVGSCNRYQLVDGASLMKIQMILSGNGHTKNLSKFLREATLL